MDRVEKVPVKCTNNILLKFSIAPPINPYGKPCGPGTCVSLSNPVWNILLVSRVSTVMCEYIKLDSGEWKLLAQGNFCLTNK